MMSVIVNITDGVAAGLRTRIKTFGQNGLNRMYLRGENTERMILDRSFIVYTLNQIGVLPNGVSPTSFKIYC
jgi:hypothetical protein